MSDFSHLADRFKNKFGLGGAHRPNDPYQYSGASSPGSQQPIFQGYQQYSASTYPSPPSYPSPSGYASGPPPIPARPGSSAPPIPPRFASSSPRIYGPELDSLLPQTIAAPAAGALFGPGLYPTPELTPYPLGQSLTLIPSSPSEYTSVTIQNALNKLGPSATLYLPPRSQWQIHAPIELQDYQEIATLGYPTLEAEMAILGAEEDCRPHVLHAFSKSGIRIRNLIIEGNKEKHGWDKDGGVMVQLGGGPAFNQVLDHCILRNPRHWSCVQAFEGAEDVRITNNRIGPAGVGSDQAEFRWADGVSYAASHGLVAGNLVVDTTDGAIVLFNAPGTLVTSNTIVAQTRLGLGAINMVDQGPHDGNYGFTRVTHNTIVTAGTMLKTGIGQGCSVWGQQSKRQIIRGGIVLHNLITRDLRHISGPVTGKAGDPQLGDGIIGYGFPVGADVIQWTCRDNLSEDNVQYSGDISSTLPNFLNASPGPFIYDKFGNAPGDEADMNSLVLQNEFVVGKVWGLISIKPGDSKVLAFDAGGLKLRLGDRLHLHGIQIVFRKEDAELAVFQPDDNGGGLWLWEAGSAGKVDSRPNRNNALLIFSESGKIGIVDSEHPTDVWWDFTQHVPYTPPPPLPSGRPNTPRLIFSSDAPYLTATSASGDILYASSYSVPRLTEYPVGKFVARPTPLSGGGALVYSFSPQRQFVIAHTRSDFHTIEWPLDQTKFQILKTFGEPDYENVDDPAAKLVFQGDGNLVVYASDGNAPWSSGTCGDRSAMAMLFGLGSYEEPFVELQNEEGRRVWSA